MPLRIRRGVLLGIALTSEVVGDGAVVDSMYEKPIISLNSWCLNDTNASGNLGKSMCPYVPQLSDGTSSAVDVTSAVRDWVSQNMVVAASPGVYGPERHWEIPALAQIESMAKHEYGYLCGSFAQVLSQMYNELGLEANTYNFGHPDYFSHVVTLVKLPREGEIIQDAYYGGLLVDSLGKPVALGQALSILKRESQLSYENSPSSRKYIIEAKGPKESVDSWDWLQRAANQTRCEFVRDGQAEGLKVFSCEAEGYSYPQVELDPKAKTFLEGRGLPLNLFQLLRFPIS